MAEEVFMRAFIPRSLDEIIDYERDLIKAQKGQQDDVCFFNNHFSTICFWLLISLLIFLKKNRFIIKKQLV